MLPMIMSPDSNAPQYGEISSAGPYAAPIIMDAFADLLR